MSKPHLMAQIYGYLVCLVAIITFLICVTALINAIIAHGDPLHAGYRSDNSPSLASFENYKMDVLKSSSKNAESAKVDYIPDDKTLHAMYESARSEKIQSSLYESNRSIIVDIIVIIISILFFGTHWIWMRKLAKSSE